MTGDRAAGVFSARQRPCGGEFPLPIWRQRITDEAPPSGEVELDGRRWEWEAHPIPPREGEPAPLLGWHEFRFRLQEDPDQMARIRAGVPAETWSPDTLNQVLRGARERIWRDVDGRLWKVKRTGWPAAVGGTARLKEGEAEAPPIVLFHPLEDTSAEPAQSPARDLPSLTGASDEELQALLTRSQEADS